MKLESYAIDDLHSMATAELEHDPAAIVLLNSYYRAARDHYAELLKLIRITRESQRMEQVQ
jgi:hypothetical protein